MRVLIDTNVILDVLLERHPHYPDSVAVWNLAEQGQIEGYLSAVSFTNIHYIVRKAHGIKAASRVLRAIRSVFAVAPCDGKVISQAIDADSTDFEDSVQLFSGANCGVSVIVTRNPEHFSRSHIQVASPGELLASRARRDV